MEQQFAAKFTRQYVTGGSINLPGQVLPFNALKSEGAKHDESKTIEP